jgi:DNA-directed RNA polymerase subunit RPC12/RpoP
MKSIIGMKSVSAVTICPDCGDEMDTLFSYDPETEKRDDQIPKFCENCGSKLIIKEIEEWKILALPPPFHIVFDSETERDEKK